MTELNTPVTQRKKYESPDVMQRTTFNVESDYNNISAISQFKKK